MSVNGISGSQPSLDGFLKYLIDVGINPNAPVSEKISAGVARFGVAGVAVLTSPIWGASALFGGCSTNPVLNDCRYWDNKPNPNATIILDPSSLNANGNLTLGGVVKLSINNAWGCDGDAENIQVEWHVGSQTTTAGPNDSVEIEVLESISNITAKLIDTKKHTDRTITFFNVPYVESGEGGGSRDLIAPIEAKSRKPIKLEAVYIKPNPEATYEHVWTIMDNEENTVVTINSEDKIAYYTFCDTSVDRNAAPKTYWAKLTITGEGFPENGIDSTPESFTLRQFDMPFVNAYNAAGANLEHPHAGDRMRIWLDLVLPSPRYREFPIAEDEHAVWDYELLEYNPVTGIYDISVKSERELLRHATSEEIIYPYINDPAEKNYQLRITVRGENTIDQFDQNENGSRTDFLCEEPNEHAYEITDTSNITLHGGPAPTFTTIFPTGPNARGEVILIEDFDEPNPDATYGYNWRVIAPDGTSLTITDNGSPTARAFLRNQGRYEIPRNYQVILTVAEIDPITRELLTNADGQPIMITNNEDEDETIAIYPFETPTVVIDGDTDIDRIEIASGLKNYPLRLITERRLRGPEDEEATYEYRLYPVGSVPPAVWTSTSTLDVISNPNVQIDFAELGITRRTTLLLEVRAIGSNSDGNDATDDNLIYGAGSSYITDIATKEITVYPRENCIEPPTTGPVNRNLDEVMRNQTVEWSFNVRESCPGSVTPQLLVNFGDGTSWVNGRFDCDALDPLPIELEGERWYRACVNHAYSRIPDGGNPLVVFIGSNGTAIPADRDIGIYHPRFLRATGIFQNSHTYTTPDDPTLYNTFINPSVIPEQFSALLYPSDFASCDPVSTWTLDSNPSIDSVIFAGVFNTEGSHLLDVEVNGSCLWEPINLTSYVRVNETIRTGRITTRATDTVVGRAETFALYIPGMDPQDANWSIRNILMPALTGLRGDFTPVNSTNSITGAFMCPGLYEITASTVLPGDSESTTAVEQMRVHEGLELNAPILWRQDRPLTLIVPISFRGINYMIDYDNDGIVDETQEGVNGPLPFTHTYNQARTFSPILTAAEKVEAGETPRCVLEATSRSVTVTPNPVPLIALIASPIHHNVARSGEFTADFDVSGSMIWDPSSGAAGAYVPVTTENARLFWRFEGEDLRELNALIPSHLYDTPGAKFEAICKIVSRFDGSFNQQTIIIDTTW